MKPFLFLAIAVVILAVLGFVAVFAKKLFGGAPSGKLPYERIRSLLTPAERSFFEVLRGITGEEILVFVKVRMEDLLYLPKGTPERQSYINRVRSKHVDFVLCDREKISPILVIELNDRSHESQSRQDRDAFLQNAFDAAGIPILWVTAQASYNPRQLAEQIQSAMSVQKTQPTAELQGANLALSATRRRFKLSP
jgi:very-short-patch-repair endonuclease